VAENFLQMQGIAQRPASAREPSNDSGRVEVVSNELDKQLDDDKTPLTDKAIFWPAFAIFVVLLVGIYVLTSPPGSDVLRVLFDP
jgi:hypothetical protein